MTHFQIVCAALVGVFASARLVRLIVFDHYPPMVWLRDKWRTVTHDGSWALLVDCPYCVGPYVSALVFGLGYGLDWPTWWWIACSGLAAAYAASIVVAYDGDES